jgi:competence protein ComEC
VLRLMDVTVNGESVPGDVRAHLYHDEGGRPHVQYGMVIMLRANTWPADPPGGPEQFDYELYMKRNGLALSASTGAPALTVLSKAPDSFRGRSFELKTRVADIIKEQYGDNAPLMLALILGDKNELPDERYSSYKAAGVAHLLSISGLHISLLAFAVNAALKKLNLAGWAAFFITIVFLLGYAFLTGFPVSVIRALIMFAMMSGAGALGRPGDSLTGLMAAFLALTLANPLYITDAGFLLSFTSVAGLLMIMPGISPRKTARSVFAYAGNSIALTASAQLGSLPVVVWAFHQYPVYSILSNLIAVPLVAAALPFAMSGILLAGTVFGNMASGAANICANGLNALSETIARLPRSVINVPHWPAWLIALYALAMFACSPYARNKLWARRALIASMPAMCAAAILIAFLSRGSGLEVVFLNAGQADAAIVNVSGGAYAVDVGAGTAAADYFLHYGISPGGVFLTHPHSDHAGGIDNVLALSGSSVLYLPSGWDEVRADATLRDMEARARAAGWSVEYLAAGDTITLSDGVTAEVTNPERGHAPGGANSLSMALVVKYGEGSVYFTGDLPLSNDAALLPDCDVLKVPHHGGKGYMSAASLELISPSAAIIPVGRNNYSHPSGAAIDLLKDACARVYRTDLHGNGTVKVEKNGAISVSAWKNPGGEWEAAS